MSFTEIQLFQLLKTKLGDREAEYLVSYVKDEVKNDFDNKKDILATKKNVANCKAEIIKWMFLFWIGQVAVTIGMVFTFINSVIK
ncbi:MAG: hypothetical protein EAZ51_00610 [Sphingobacteriales bacterium]|nr:MAG: hypothetical protein EAZ64_02435 [Sphingobacteriales bacterium]TAF83770.1 MAG: hypothetical protein EAZ51_00610 [Sphingobacteriales bacterium]